MGEENRRPGRSAGDRSDRPGHPDLAELDAFRTGEAGAEVRSHVEGCERCRRVAEELGEFAGEIGAALRGAEVDVPADVDGRLRAMARARAVAVRSAARSAARETDGDTLQAATGDIVSSLRPAGEGQPSRDIRKVSASTRDSRTIYFSWPGWVAAAATVLIAVGVTMSVRRREAPGVASPLADADADAMDTTRAMDIDRSGRVDIIDAYLMSRRLGTRAVAPRSWDFDRDGAVGEADVKAVAMQAVALADGGI